MRDPYKWDKYFMSIAQVVANNSSCMSRKIGAVLTRGKAIVATGYNGPPAYTPHCDERYDQDKMLRRELLDCIDEAEWDKTKCPRRLLGYPSGAGLYLCPATHAEANCICNAAKLGVQTLGTVMYMTCGIPCKNCIALLINAGVHELVVSNLETYDELSRFLIIHAGLQIRCVNSSSLFHGGTV